MSEPLGVLVLVGTALGFYCVGRLHPAAWLDRRIEEIFRRGYRLGRKHGAESDFAPQRRYTELVNESEASKRA